MQKRKPYTVEVKYLLPVFQTVVVHASDPEEACKRAIVTADDDWENGEESSDSAGSTTVCALAEGRKDLLSLKPKELLGIPPKLYFECESLEFSLLEKFPGLDRQNVSDIDTNKLVEFLRKWVNRCNEVKHG